MLVSFGRVVRTEGKSEAMKESRMWVRRLVFLAMTLWACVIWLKNSEVAEAATGEEATQQEHN